MARTHAQQHLGGQHVGITRQAEHAQCIAGDDLRAAVGVEIRGVDEIDAAVERGLDEIGDVFLRNAGDRGPHAFATAEGHGAEAHFRNDEARVAELAITHLHTPKGAGEGISHGVSALVRRALARNENLTAPPSEYAGAHEAR